MKLKRFFKRTAHVIYNHRADIEFMAGLGFVITGTILLIKDSSKIAEAIDEHTYRARMIEEIDEEESNNPGEGWRDIAERKKFIKEDIIETSKDFCKTVVKDCAFIVGGEVLQGISHKSLKGQLANATILAANLSTAYANLKQKVVEDQGEEKLNEYLYGPVVKKVVVDEEGNVTETIEMVKDENENINLPPHCFFFDESNNKFSKSRGVNKDTLYNLQHWLDEKLWYEGFLFENDIRREVGAELVECGWTSGIFAEDENGNRNHLSFGFDSKDPATLAFIEGSNPSYLIKLNMEDDILSKLHLRKH